ncbi:MAG: DUF1080 domain-containing protein [Verrucomicrobia bacterium]|nr:DUF1080 domain-containing protein [Verrucomicrobiota bacterium]HNU99901.1 DUF1080 domain-containing protein [Verrucomicrobiota bacterium]HOA60156.1 DUF1080 domain-containing protein [Verrucomicrobiota bacterium]HOF47820.1 DUF1080 domain-containing protein [Verrucomicrobiota bacterium]HOG88629.1 DUF1080 domain-containing protein [Verrucomicrobiota bacterium]
MLNRSRSMTLPHHLRFAMGLIAAFVVAGCRTADQSAGWRPLFPEDGVPQGWLVRHWADLRNPPPADTEWRVSGGVLSNTGSRGTWLISEAEYGDFDLDYEFKLGERGNSGCALRAPLFGDPAFDGLELQMVDLRYNPEATPSELTGSLYRAVAPRRQCYRATDWNRYQITCRGPHIRVLLNGEQILDVNLDAQTASAKRHNGEEAPALRLRPRRGHIGFQELSRDDVRVQVRNARIRPLD